MNRYEEFKNNALENPKIKEEYDKLENKYKLIQLIINMKKLLKI